MRYDGRMDEELIDSLERLVVGSVAITERAIAEAGADLTFVQWRVLLIVGQHDQGATVGEIAARIGAHNSPASRLISRLKRRGVVTTHKDQLDARVTRATLTVAGRELRARVLGHRRDILEELLDGWSLTREDARAISRLA